LLGHEIVVDRFQNLFVLEDFANVFKLLCQEEAKHKQILETIYDDFMAEQGD